MQRWTKRPEGSTWGDFGPDDQLGRLNLLTEKQVLKGVQEVREGKVFCLSLPLDLPGGSLLNPSRMPPQLSPTQRNGRPRMNYPLAKADPTAVDVVCDDQVLLTLQYSTQWDAFSHIGAYFDVSGTDKPEKVYYNGYKAGEHIVGPIDYDGDAEHDCSCNHSATGATKLGIENFAVKGMQGRGVLVDLARHFGRERVLVGYQELMEVMRKDNVVVEPGDMLVLRTGFAEAVVEMAGQPDADTLHGACAVLDGADDRLLQWITDSGIVAVCADNYAVEAFPARERTGKKALLPLHHHCLFKLGVPLAELWYLKDLADWLRDNKRNRFLLTAPPLRLPRAVGSPVTPIATV
ncbi:cyclase family protein [Herbaspirillum sp. HC18]|nr:cyclase family protein [Herbaspirillum sp. HC18]